MTNPEEIEVEDDRAWTKLAEPSFAFWDNADDSIYDALQPVSDAPKAEE